MYKAYICSWDEARRYVGSYTIYKNDKVIYSRDQIELPHCTCNEAEYLTLLKLMMKLGQLGIFGCKIYTNVEMVARQINGQWGVKAPNLVNYVREGQRLRKLGRAQVEFIEHSELRKWIKAKQITWRVGA